MKFEERAKRPIYVYSTNIDELHALQNFGRFCVKTKAGTFGDQLDRLLVLLYFTLTSQVWGRCRKLYDAICKRSLKNGQVVSTLGEGVRLLRQQEDTLLIAWARGLTAAIRKARPQSTIRIASLLRSLCRLQAPTEKLIIDSANRIVQEYRRHRQESEAVAGEELMERSTKPARGFNATAGFAVSDRIVPYCTGKATIPREHAGFCKFDFPQRGMRESPILLRLDRPANKLLVETADHLKTMGDFFVGDISSMVTDDTEGRKVLKINGRRIKKPESFGDELNENPGQVVYTDPANQFLAPSIDSYLTKKTLFELKIYLVRIQKLEEIMKEMKTPDVAFRVKIWAGDRFWAATPFSRPKLKKKGGMCEFKQTYRVRVDPAFMDAVMVSLWVCPIESGKLPDVLESLKREMSLGFSRVRLNNIPEQKKVLWIPLNNDTYPDKPFAGEDDPMISLNYKLIPNLPGNFPEIPMWGKQYTIGDMAYYNEEMSLRYPGSQAEFDMLQRADIKFDPARVNTNGTPLRYPATEEEWRTANLEDRPFRPDEVSVETLKRIQNRVPFMFRMPKNKETFAFLQLPGNYAKLSKKYKGGEIVKEMDSFEAKQVCVLKGMDKEDNCYLTLAEHEEGQAAVITVSLVIVHGGRKSWPRSSRPPSRVSPFSTRAIIIQHT